jgi:hypothetical protein
MNVETYLRDRVQDQIAYYSSKSRVNKKSLSEVANCGHCIWRVSAGLDWFF